MRAVIVRAVFGMLVVLAATTPLHAAPSTFSINVSDAPGSDVTGSGSITVPGDSGSDATGVSLTLNALIYGNSVTFHETDILGISWTATVPTLVVTDLTLASFDVPTLFLVDNGSNTGEADCSAGGCPGSRDANATTVHWTYTPQTAAIPEPGTLALLLTGLGIAGAVGGRYSSRR